MLRIFYIFWREYWGNVTRRSYLIFTFGFPIFMIATPLIGGVILAIAIRSALPVTDPRPVGIVDQANLFTNALHQPSNPVEIIFYADSQTAADALANNKIQAYYQIPANYWESGEVTLTYDQAPTEQVDSMVTGWIRAQIRAKASPDVLKRLDQGPNISHHGLANAGTFAQADMTEPVLVYLVLYFVRLAGAFTASYMFDSVASEANDRTLEIMITSVSAFQFVTGKLLGLLAVGLTQIGMWGGVVLLFAIGGSWLLGVNLLSFLLSWEHLWLMINVLLATYLMDQILAAAMGLMKVSGGAGNVLFNTINSVVGISLIYAAYFVPRNPDSVLAVTTSLFPLTAPLVMLIRVAVSQVPAWQIAVCLVLLWGTNLLGLFWLRPLLKSNLVAGSTRFELRPWLKSRFVDLKAAVPMGSKS